MESPSLQAVREQAEIDAETAASRCLEAASVLDRLAGVRLALESGDDEQVARAAVDFHRTHALHEQQAGRSGRSQTAQARAGRAQLRLDQIRAQRLPH